MNFSPATIGQLVVRTILAVVVSNGLCLHQTEAQSAEAPDAKPPRRLLRVAVYPYVPERAEMLVEIQKRFERDNDQVRLEFVDLGADYYNTDLLAAFAPASKDNQLAADVVEVDTVFLQDLVKDSRVAAFAEDELKADPDLAAETNYLPLANQAVRINGQVYGVPHWVCSNFLFYRKDDPEHERINGIRDLKSLETLLHHPNAEADGVLTDVRGGTTVGELYASSLLGEFGDAGTALAHLGNKDQPDEKAVAAVMRLVDLCPNRMNHVKKYHSNGQFYARQFSHRDARGFIGYSEELYFAQDEFIHGVAEKEPAVGDPTKADIAAIPAPFYDQEPKHPLGWVDAMTMRSGLNAQQRQDALAFIRTYTSFKYNLWLLVPATGHPMRYLLPARKALYNEPTLLDRAPLYSVFGQVMENAVTMDAPKLVPTLQEIGSTINRRIDQPPPPK